MKPKNRLRGRRNNRAGRSFEALIAQLCDQYFISLVKIPEAARTIGAGKIIREKSPFDFVAGYRGRTAFFDAKLCSDTRFSYSRINRSQCKHLFAFSRQNLPAGYVIFFAKQSTIVFVDVNRLLAVRPRASLGPEDGVCLDGNFSTIFYNRVAELVI